MLSKTVFYWPADLWRLLSKTEFFCLLEMLHNLPLPVCWVCFFFLICFFLCIRASNFSSQYHGMTGSTFTGKNTNRWQHFFICQTLRQFNFFQIFLFSSIIHTPMKISLWPGNLLLLGSFSELCVLLWWWMRFILVIFFFFPWRQWELPLREPAHLFPRWSCCGDLRTVTWAPGCSGALVWMGRWLLPVC